MTKACFVHMDAYASQWQWITVSGTHEALRNYMPLWSKKTQPSYGFERISLKSRSVHLVRKPLGFTHKLGARISDVIEALEEVGDIELVNEKEWLSKGDDGYKKYNCKNVVYVNISTYEKQSNVLAAALERVTAYAPFSAIFTAAKTVAQVAVTANKIKQDFGIKNKKIRLTITGHRDKNTYFVIKRHKVTCQDIADILKGFSNKGADHNEIRLLLDELFRNGVGIISSV